MDLPRLASNQRLPSWDKGMTNGSGRRLGLKDHQEAATISRNVCVMCCVGKFDRCKVLRMVEH